MFPLTIKDLPVEAWDVIDALGLVPVKLTNDYAPELYWSVYADCDCLRNASVRDFFGISYPEELSPCSFVQSSFECCLFPPSFEVEHEFKQLELFDHVDL